MVLPLHSVCLRVADERLGRDFGQQIIEHLAVVRLVEKIDERFGDDRADALHRRKFGLAALRQCDAPQLLDGAEAFEQVAAVTMPTWRMPRPNRKRGPSGSTLGLDRGEEIVDRFLLPALAAEQIGAVVRGGGKCPPASAASQGR